MRAGKSRRSRAGRHTRHAERLGPHAARLESRHRSFHIGRLVLPSGPGGRAEHAGELRGRCRALRRCAVVVTGNVVPSPAKGQPFEVQASRVEVIGGVEDPDTYPIQPKPHTLEFCSEVAHLRPRTNVIGAVTRVRDAIAHATHRFFHDHGFFWINTPIITTSGRGRRRDVPRVDARPREPPADRGQPDRLCAGFLRPRNVPDGIGAAQRRDVLHALSKVYTFGRRFAPKTRTRAATSPNSG